MGASSWPSAAELDEVRKVVVEMSGKDVKDVRIVVCPYRICPLGAHIDHQGGIVSAMTINKGILLGFIPSCDGQVVLRSGQFQGEVKFRVDEEQFPKINTPAKRNASSEACKLDWGCYARGALYALQSGGYHLAKGIVGFVRGSDGLDSSGLSSSAAVGIAYLLALENANNLSVSPKENIEFDRVIENKYFGLKNGILDQSAILLSKYGCLTCIDCKTKEHMLVYPEKLNGNWQPKGQEAFKILLAFSGLKHALTSNPDYNQRVSECQEAARLLLDVSGNEKKEPLLCNVDRRTYEAQKGKLKSNLAKRAEHYFSENMRVEEGRKAWASGKLADFGKLISASGHSSIWNYECGCGPMKQLYEILLEAPGVFGARFSGAGFRGCCVAFVDATRAEEAATYVEDKYRKAQPELVGHLSKDRLVLICEAGDCACVI